MVGRFLPWMHFTEESWSISWQKQTEASWSKGGGQPDCESAWTSSLLMVLTSFFENCPLIVRLSFTETTVSPLRSPHSSPLSHLPPKQPLMPLQHSTTHLTPSPSTHRLPEPPLRRNHPPNLRPPRLRLRTHRLPHRRILLLLRRHPRPPNRSLRTRIRPRPRPHLPPQRLPRPAPRIASPASRLRAEIRRRASHSMADAEDVGRGIGGQGGLAAQDD